MSDLLKHVSFYFHNIEKRKLQSCTERINTLRT